MSLNQAVKQNSAKVEEISHEVRTNCTTFWFIYIGNSAKFKLVLAKTKSDCWQNDFRAVSDVKQTNY